MNYTKKRGNKNNVTFILQMINMDVFNNVTLVCMICESSKKKNICVGALRESLCEKDKKGRRVDVCKKCQQFCHNSLDTHDIFILPSPSWRTLRSINYTAQKRSEANNMDEGR